MQKPNIILVLTDDQGIGDLGCHGNPWLITPNIDSFYRESVRLSDYHVGPTCAPTRASLFTGHYANSTGVWHTIGGRSLLRENEWTIANALSENGYSTGIFGKWHLGDSYPYRAKDRGFQKSIVHGGGGISQTPDFWGNDYFDDTYLEDGIPRKFYGYCTDVFFSEAIQFIEYNVKNNQSFFCCITTNAPHSPYNVPEKYRRMYENKVMPARARFYGMITNIDENFGKLRQKLQQLQIEDDTILVFMTDNGSSEAVTFAEDGTILEGFNAGFRGQKGSEYEGGHRTPCFIKWKNGTIYGGRDVSQPTANIDFMPTILDLCGISTAGHKFDGISLKNVLTKSNEKLETRIIVTDSQRVPQPIKWKQSCVIEEKWRLINGTELYNLTNDLAQQHDVSNNHPDVVKRLRKGYEDWWRIVSKQFYDPIPLHLSSGNMLTTHDWYAPDECCLWNQGLIREGKPVCGQWQICISDQAEYTLRCYRWHPCTHYQISQEIDGEDCLIDKNNIQPEYLYYYCGGNSVPAVSAKLLLDGIDMATVSLTGQEEYAEFKVTFPAGNHNLEVYFEDNNLKRTGCYYIVVL